jgi:flavin reductase (DIM6/NTAB) family NADH-FMN oxidoreductase RutF
MTFTERTFRDALGLFPTGVAVVTAVTKDGTRIGATISSFNSVSLSPPLVLFSIARTSRSFAAWTEVRPLIFYKGSYQKIERDYDPNTPSDFYYLLNGW